MEKMLIAFICATGLLTINMSSFAEDRSLCDKTDAVCNEFEALTDAGRFESIISKVDGTREYSERSRTFIGKAYLALAADEKNTPEQEEAFCRKAVEFGAMQGYMGLYFIHVQRNEEQALGYLREYVKTQPRDSVPYVILGQSELNRNNYALADSYLRESRRVSRAKSANVAWMLFQANYLMGNYHFAAEMIETALKSGTFDKELKALSVDPRFKGIEKRPELKKFQSQIAAARQ